MVELRVFLGVFWPLVRFKIYALMLRPHVSLEPAFILKFCSTEFTYHHCSDLHFYFNNKATLLLFLLAKKIFPVEYYTLWQEL